MNLAVTDQDDRCRTALGGPSFSAAIELVDILEMALVEFVRASSAPCAKYPPSATASFDSMICRDRSGQPGKRRRGAGSLRSTCRHDIIILSRSLIPRRIKRFG